MQSSAATPEEYIAGLPPGRREAVSQLRKTILENLPAGFREVMNYGMLGYVVPHDIYPGGYHADPKQPLPFINIASQKNHISIYHMGLYSDPDLLEWFSAEYLDRTRSKPDMGKSCIRFRKHEEIPCKLIGELASRMSVAEWITIYEKNIRKK